MNTTRERIAEVAAANGWTQHNIERTVIEYRRGSRHVCIYFSGIESIVSASCTGGAISGTGKAQKVIAELERGTR